MSHVPNLAPMSARMEVWEAKIPDLRQQLIEAIEAKDDFQIRRLAIQLHENSCLWLGDLLKIDSHPADVAELVIRIADLLIGAEEEGEDSE